ncbi:GAMT [Branchiostoma lanceolatum]|uniref:GAMT protein n=1 Tax=Branchiostoma lanceolatum TaxID=7740 RepID=A0A8J9Z6Y1_BRALA|nr:GAMT [Branchiostoma lanceolatum]
MLNATSVCIICSKIGPKNTNTRHAFRFLTLGGVLTYCNLSPWGELLKEKYDNIETMFKALGGPFSETQISHLVNAGFRKENISWEVITIQLPSDPRKYQFPLMIAPKEQQVSRQPLFGHPDDVSGPSKLITCDHSFHSWHTRSPQDLDVGKTVLPGDTHQSAEMAWDQDRQSSYVTCMKG